MDLGLDGKRCVIVGGGRGLGAEVAYQLAVEGARVVVLSRSPAELEATRARIGEIGRTAVAVVGDIADPVDGERALGDALAAFGGVDVLVNSATASVPGGLAQICDEQWERGFAVKPLGFARAARVALPSMRAAGGGRIVNICGSGGRYVDTAYVLGGLNAATLHFTKLLAEAEADNGISVIAINPGPIGTERLESYFAAEAGQLGVGVAERKAAYLADVPLRRVPSAAEVAKIVVMFCSDLTEYCTGSAVQVDGATTRGIF